MENRVPSMPYLLSEMFQDGRYRYGIQPLYLGGTSGSNGGQGIPSGGIIGHLVQTKVAYDTTEAASTSGSSSLLDNLNHIRYRIQSLENNPTATIGFQRLITEGTNVTPELSAIAYDYITIESSGSLSVSSGASVVVTSLGDTSIAPKTVSSDYEVKLGDTLVICNSSSSINLYLPPCDYANTRREFKFKKSGSGFVTLNPYSTATIDGSTSTTLSVGYTSISLVSDGENWSIV